MALSTGAGPTCTWSVDGSKALSSALMPTGARCLPAAGGERQQDVLHHLRLVQDQQHVPVQLGLLSPPFPASSAEQAGELLAVLEMYSRGHLNIELTATQFGGSFYDLCFRG